MEATILSAPVGFQFSPPPPPTTRRKTLRKHSVVSVLTRPAPFTVKDDGDDDGRCRRAKIEPVNKSNAKTVYNDSWLEKKAINYLSQAVQETTGMKNNKNGYESLVVVAGMVFRRFKAVEQRELVVQALESMIPGPILFLIRTVMPPSKFSREYFATFTTIFFPWLIGHCEVRESEFEGRKEKNVVHIKKCRFLEETNCAGMCTNLCKMPSQEFIKSSFGIPVNMVPNFDDMSCEMIFGQDPPAEEDDPAFKRPCYELCDVKQKHRTSCIS